MPALNLVYLPAEFLGYGRCGIDLAAGLRRVGVTPLPLEDGAVSGRSGRGGVCRTALWVSSPDLLAGWWDGQFRAMLTMYETRHVPEGFRAGLRHVERVLVPSAENLETFSAFHRDVVQITHGIDTDRWAFRTREQPARRFRFLTAGDGARKGGDLAAAAFAAAFPRDPPNGPAPELVMKVPRGAQHFGRAISHVAGRLTPGDECELYASAHCFVAPARGEGFGLQPLQAIAQGCPTILTDAHGHRSFADLGIAIPARPAPAGRFFYGPSGEWWEPDFDALVQAMRAVYAAYPAALASAARAAAVARERFNLSRFGESVLSALGPDALGPYEGGHTWCRPGAYFSPALVRAGGAGGDPPGGSAPPS